MKNVSAALALCFLLAASAALLAADPPEAYEMTTYQVAFLVRGPAWTPGESEELKALQKAHMEHIGRMAATGKLVIAGPFADGGDLRGVFHLPDRDPRGGQSARRARSHRQGRPPEARVAPLVRREERHRHSEGPGRGPLAPLKGSMPSAYNRPR